MRAAEGQVAAPAGYRRQGPGVNTVLCVPSGKDRREAEPGSPRVLAAVPPRWQQISGNARGLEAVAARFVRGGAVVECRGPIHFGGSSRSWGFQHADSWSCPDEGGRRGRG